MNRAAMPAARSLIATPAAGHLSPVRVSVTILLSVLAALLPACSRVDPDAPAAQADSAAPLAGAAIGGPFTLVDKNGRTVRWSDFAGRYRIVYFGYTFCPDACPLDVTAMMKGFDQFAAAHSVLAAQVQPLFITIDPARDTPKVIGEYAAAFSPRLEGLSGSAAQVDAAAKAFRVYYAKGETNPGGYLMDHSRIAYLMGRDGAPLSMLPVDKGPAAVAQELERWVH